MSTHGFLFLDFGEEKFTYIIGNRLYFPFDLHPIEESISDFLLSHSSMLVDLIPLEIIHGAQSELIIVGTEAGYLIVASSTPGTYQVLHSSESPDDILPLKILDLDPLPILIPDRSDLPPFDPHSLAMLARAIGQKTVGQVFGSNLPLTRIVIGEFPYIEEEIRKGSFTGWRLDSRFEHWAKEPNKVVTLFDRRGDMYLVVASVEGNMIYPSV